MAPTILSSLRNLTSELLSIIPSYPSRSSTVREEIEKLRTLVSRIQATVIDAEERDVTDESVKLWLLDFKQIVHDAENILNDFNYELLSIEVENKFQIDKKKRKFEVIDSTISPTFDDSIVESILLRIKEVVEKFEEFSRIWAILSLEKVDGVKKSMADTRTPSSSVINLTENIIGRDDRKCQIIDSMLAIDEIRAVNVKVISILSMGGMGKTTLAKLVYNNVRVEQHFCVRSWVWVSESFDEVKISKSILESIVDRPCDYAQLDSFQMEIRNNLRGKRFLIVLDDLWNEDQTRWNAVLAPLLYGADGSCILITTRNSNVAKTAGTNLLIPLGELPENESWNLFCHYAFHEMQPNSVPQNLVDIGKGIVRKCKGLPLIIRTLGSLLAFETEEESWDYIHSSNVWELEACKTSIIPILKLSYRLLPPHLKQCFIYCAAFPKGHVFELENLVHLWLAQGFIKNHPYRQMEAIGLMYAHDLLQRSFFQDLSASKVTMHDLMHDLAQAISNEEICITVNEQFDEVRRRKHLRHLTILVEQEGYVSLKKCLDGLSLKSLIVIGSNNAKFFLEPDFFDNPSIANLYVLDLNFLRSYRVPNSISNLKHLRYLGLSGQKLPDSICDLYHLETLNLRTRKIKGMLDIAKPLTLPRNIRHLINLRHLLVDPWEIPMMPRGIGSLANLQSLSLFALSKNPESTSLGELTELNNLRGTLHIRNLDHTMCNQPWGTLTSKKHLNHLIFSFRKEFSAEAKASKEHKLLQVLEYCLKPYTNIKQVTVEYYKGPELPSWFVDGSCSNLRNIRLYDCSECKQLPAFGQLPHLIYLKLDGFSSLEVVGTELLGYKTIAFPSLEVLIIYNMPILVNWFFGEERENSFPNLREVHLSLCKSLSVFQLSTISPLDKLNVSWCDRLETIYGFDGSWSVIAKWKSILDSSKGEDDTSLSKLHNALNILDSRVLKLQKEAEAEKSLTAYLKLTIVGCPMLQKSYLTCTADKMKVRRTIEEIISSDIVSEGNGGIFRIIKRSLRRPDILISKAELESHPTTSTNLSKTMNHVRNSIIKDPNMANLNDSSENHDGYKSPMFLTERACRTKREEAVTTADRKYGTTTR